MKKLALCLAITSALGLTACDDTSLEDVQNALEEERQTAVEQAEQPRATVVWDPSNGLLSVPNDLLFSGTTDFTLELPDEVAAKLAGTTDWGNPGAALGALDGWGTQNAISIAIDYETADDGSTVLLDPASIAAAGGNAVAIYPVVTYPELSDPECSDASLAGFVCKASERLVFGVDYVATVSGGNVVVVPLKPFPAGKSFAIVLTNEIKDLNGNSLGPSSTYGTVKANLATSPLVDPNKPAEELSETEAGIKFLQTLINNFEGTIASQAGATQANIVYTQVFTTQSAGVPQTDPLQVIKQLNAQSFGAMAAANPASVLTQMTYQNVNVAQAFAAQGLIANDPASLPYLLYSAADLYGAQIQLPYYLGKDENTLTSRWEAACDSGVQLATLSQEQLAALAANAGPNHEVCSAIGLADFGIDQERHLTKFNPLPAVKSVEAVNVQITLPNVDAANIVRGAQGLPGLAGKPEGGWPVVILQHGITSQKEDMLAATGFLSMFGFATVAIDHPLHGSRGFSWTESINDVDVPMTANATTNSATDYLNLSSLLTARDNLRQSVADALQLRLSLNAIGDFTNPAAPDLAVIDSSKVYYLGHSLGAITGTPFAAVANTPVEDPALAALYNVDAVMLANPGGSIANFLTQSGAFGPLVNASVTAGLGNEASEALLAYTATYGDIVAANPSCAAALGEGGQIVDMNVALVCMYNAFLANESADIIAASQAGVAEFAFAAQAIIDSADPTNYAGLLSATQTPVLMVEMVGDGELNLPDQVIPNSVAGNAMAGTSGLANSLGLPAVTASVLDSSGSNSGIVRFRYGSHSTMLSPSTDLPEPYVTLFAGVNQELNTMMAYFFMTDGGAITISDTMLNACAIAGGGPAECTGAE